MVNIEIRLITFFVMEKLYTDISFYIFINLFRRDCMPPHNVAVTLAYATDSEG